jgi:CheY-like chemotaxis protein
VPGLGVVLLVVGIVGAFGVRLRSARKRTRVLEQEIEERKRAQELLANMSHEIRTPMNAILGYAQLLQRDRSLREDQKRQLEIVQRSGNHLLALINDILEMSRLEAGRATVVSESFDLYALLADIELMFRELTGAKGLGLEVELAPELPRTIEGDAGKVRQVMINLLSNAVKFTDTGGIRVRAAARRVGSAAGDRLRVTLGVEDTGCGIPPEAFERIFDPFDQSESGARSGGTGLGLAISRNFARLMRGGLTVQSTVGRGSSFTFTFEASETSEAAAPAHDTGPLPIALVAGSPPPRVLIVDDMATNRQLLGDLLSRIGFETTVAASGEDAIDAYGTRQPDLVLMDLGMPGMGGLEAIRRLRTEGFKGPVFAITASALSDEETLEIRARANGWLRKPYREGELLAKIGGALGLRYVYETVETRPPSPAANAPVAAPLSDLAAELPAELVARLRDAALEARARQIAGLADEVAEHSREAAEQIRTLADGFRYETLLAALETRPNGPS